MLGDAGAERSGVFPGRTPLDFVRSRLVRIRLSQVVGLAAHCDDERAPQVCPFFCVLGCCARLRFDWLCESLKRCHISTLQTFLRTRGGRPPNFLAASTARAAGLVLLRGFIPPRAMDLIVNAAVLPPDFPHRPEVLRISKLKGSVPSSLVSGTARRNYFTREHLDAVKQWYANAPAIPAVQQQDEVREQVEAQQEQVEVQQPVEAQQQVEE